MNTIIYQISFRLFFCYLWLLTQCNQAFLLASWSDAKVSLLLFQIPVKMPTILLPVMPTLVLSPFEKVDPVSISLRLTCFSHVKYVLSLTETKS